MTFLIIPIFGFASAGVSFAGMSIGLLADPVPLGIAAGLFVGKQVGVFAASVLVIRAGWAELPMYSLHGQFGPFDPGRSYPQSRWPRALQGLLGRLGAEGCRPPDDARDTSKSWHSD